MEVEEQILYREKTKSTNRNQYNDLVKYMVEHPAIASYFTSVKTPNDRIEYQKSWQTLTKQLNMRGPPIRTLEEWKKVWRDYKYHTKKKFNLKQKIEQKILTGGSFENYKNINFNKNELDIIRILNLRPLKFAIKKIIKDNQFSTNKSTITPKQQQELEPSVIKTEPSELFYELSEIDFIDTFSPPKCSINPETANISIPELQREHNFLEDDLDFESHIRKLKIEKLKILKQTSETNQRHLELDEKMYDLKERKLELKSQKLKEKYKYKTLKLQLKKRALDLKEATKLRKK